MKTFATNFEDDENDPKKSENCGSYESRYGRR